MNLKKYSIISFGVLLGALAGYAYWYYYGCVNGCSITSSWWKTSLYGGLIGYLIIDSFNFNKIKKHGNI